MATSGSWSTWYVPWGNDAVTFSGDWSASVSRPATSNTATVTVSCNIYHNTGDYCAQYMYVNGSQVKSANTGYGVIYQYDTTSFSYSYTVTVGDGAGTITGSVYALSQASYGSTGQSSTGSYSLSYGSKTTYTVSYNANGGSGAPSSQTKYYGTSLTLSSTKPTRTGYTFKGWNTAANGSGTSYASGATYSANASVTLYAQWQQNTWTVSYNANGGTGAPSSQTKTYNVTLTLSNTTPTKTGYTFSKWNTNSGGTGTSYSPGGSYTANAAATLYAIWNIITYTVSYNANGGTGAPSSQTKNYGTALTLSSTKPSRSGYDFTGWNTAANGSGTSYASGGSYTANAAVTLYAQWSAKTTYTITFDANGGTGAPASQSGYEGTTQTLSTTKPTKSSTSETVTVTYDKVASDATIDKNSDTCTRTTSYVFSSWNTKADGTGTTYTSGQSVTMSANITLYAIYTSSVAGTVDLPSGTRAQYLLAGWSVSESDVNYLASPYAPTTDITLYAIWSPNGYGGMLRYTDADINSVSDLPFAVDDTLRLVGFKDQDNDGVYTIAALDVTNNVVTIYFDEDFQVSGSQETDGFELELYGTGTYVPDMDYICSLNNRLWGCSSKRRTIYASALGDPTDFWTFAGDSLDAYQVAVGTAGEFTGCVAMNSTVLFFKQHVVHKMYGSYPAEYTLYTYNFDGVSKTNGMSLRNCDGSAIYVTEHGIGTYSGSTSGSLSKELGEGGMNNAIAEFNGEKYILSYTDDSNTHHTYVYDLRYRMWLERDYGDVACYAHLVDDDYVLINDPDRNAIYHINSGVDLTGDWEIVYKPFIETVTGSYNSKTSIFEKKRYTSITMRLELPNGSWIKAEVQSDDGRWYPAARASGRINSVQEFRIATPRCDKLRLRLSGHGPMTILAMERQYTVGSRR